MTNMNTLIEGAKILDLPLEDIDVERFSKYKDLLKEWNQKINITSITDDEEIDIKHFLDSLVALKLDLLKGNKKIIDVGTGGGFPGLPLKIYNEDLNITLLDSLNKRIVFLNEVIDNLNLKGIEAVHGRAEELGRNPKYREEYDICISRAVASLDTLAEYCMPFVKKGGYFISMKGPDTEEEVALAKDAIKILGGEVEDVQVFNIPLSDINHSLVIIKKNQFTPKKYPRQAGTPNKKPL